MQSRYWWIKEPALREAAAMERCCDSDCSPTKKPDCQPVAVQLALKPDCQPVAVQLALTHRLVACCSLPATH